MSPNRGTIKWLTVSLFIGLTASIFAEPRDMFIVPDVSGSITSTKNPPSTREAINTMITDAKKLVGDLVRGEFDAGKHPNWRWNPELLIDPLREIVEGSPNAEPLTGPTRRVIILPFAEKGRPGTPVPHDPVVSDPIEKFPADFDKFFESQYPTTYRDQNTYVGRARAETAKVAEANEINQYYFLMITDGLDSPQPDSDFLPVDREMIKRWDSTNFVEAKTRVGLFEYRGQGAENRNFQIDIWKVDLDLPDPDSSIVLSQPTTASVPPGNVSLEWALETGGVRSKPGGLNFALTVKSETDTVIHSETVASAYQTVVTLNEPGDYTLSISAGRSATASSSVPSRVGGLSRVLTVRRPIPVGDSRIAITAPQEDPVLFTDGQAVFSWELETGGVREKPDGSYRVTMTNEETGRVIQDDVVSGYSKTIQYPTGKVPHIIRIAAEAVPGRSGIVPAQVRLVPPGYGKARIVLTDPELQDGDAAARVTAAAGSLFLGWAIESKGEQTLPEANRFRVELMAPEEDEVITSSEISGYETTLNVSDSGSYRIRISTTGDEGSGSDNIDPVVIPVYVDLTEGPEIRILGLRDGMVLNTDKLTVKWRVNPPNTPVTRYKVTLSGPVAFKPKTTSRPFHVQKIDKTGEYRLTVAVDAPPDLQNGVKPAKLLLRISPPSAGKTIALILGGVVGAIALVFLGAKMGIGFCQKIVAVVTGRPPAYRDGSQAD